MNDILKIVKDKALTYEQKVLSLAHAAESTVSPIKLSETETRYISDKIICTMFEGNAPYRPRYIVPDFGKFMKQGSVFLGLKPPGNIWEAVHFLLIFYRHIPSITSMPVYIGNIDKLLDPFINNKEEAEAAIRLFLTHIEKTITDSFCHANIGPEETEAGRIILKLAKELDFVTPNITIKINQETPEDYILQAIDCSLHAAKPGFANDTIFRREFCGEYAIASCYNGLKIGGGSHTLVRVILSNLADRAASSGELTDALLPDLVKNMASVMDKRIKFLVEESGFFQSSFLALEEFVKIDNFTAMFGLVGLAECVNKLIKKEGGNGRFGHDKKADELGLNIISRLHELVSRHVAPYCGGTNSRYLLHAQVGLSDDKDVSPGCRIPIGEEPELFEHIIQSASFHKYFPSGIGDIFVFDQTYKKHPTAIMDIIKGGFRRGMRYISFYSRDSDIVRISGYLVKKSEIAKFEMKKAVLQDTTQLGMEAIDNLKIMERKVRT